MSLLQLMPHLAKLGVPPPPEFLDYTPLPADFVAKWKEKMKPDPEQQKAKQEAQKLQMADIDAGIKLEHAKAKESGAKAMNLVADTDLKKQNTRKAAADTGTALAT